MRQTSNHALLAASLLVLAGCSVDSPVALSLHPSFAIIDPGDEIDKVTGSGHIYLGDEYRTFAFNAKTQKDGRITGEWQMNDRLAGTIAHGSVTCLGSSGNQAWIGGVILSSSDASQVGNDVYWRVVDNGEGATALPDEISEIPTLLPPGSAADACVNKPGTPALYQVVNGNIQFH